MGSHIEIEVSTEVANTSISVVTLRGEIDANTQKDIEKKADELISSGTKNLLLDLSHVTYMGSAGLRVLHIIAGKLMGTDDNTAATKFDHLKVLNPSDEVVRIFKTLGFDAYLDSYDDIDDAIKSFS